jgi:uncharacterized protein YdaU (DUF1376 family)
LSATKTDIWMPVFIGDYLADTMHLTTEQHGAYLLLLFHLWRRGILPDEDAALARITGLSLGVWSGHRPVLAAFFRIGNGTWQHGRVERERTRIEAKHKSNASRAKLGAARRWNKCAAPGLDDASSIAYALPEDADSEPESESETDTELHPSLFGSSPKSGCSVCGDQFEKTTKAGNADFRHTPFRNLLADYWRAKNSASPEMPWQGRDAKALSEFLAASPHLTETQFRHMLGNRARSAVAHGDRVYLWIGNLTRFQEEITVYNKPVSAGGSYASRAEINRNSVISAVERALSLAEEHAGRAGQAGAEPATFADTGVPANDGTGPGGCALATPGTGDYRMEAGHVAHGPAGTNGPVSNGTAITATGRTDRIGRQEVIAW